MRMWNLNPHIIGPLARSDLNFAVIHHGTWPAGPHVSCDAQLLKVKYYPDTQLTMFSDVLRVL
jgi:hypothetical protein